ncbi:MAG: hypothetical protein Q7U51_06760 [Methanoregula sp.]|nr:hypothetical protein [Methanoregula sp.]
MLTTLFTIQHKDKSIKYDGSGTNTVPGPLIQRAPAHTPHATVTGAIAAILRRTRPGNSADYFPAAGKFPGTLDAIAPGFFRPEPVRAGNIFARVPVVAENFPGQNSLAPVYTKATTRER